MAKITFEDKVALNPQPSVAEKNKCTDANINEIKASVNDLYDNLAITTGTGTMSNTMVRSVEANKYIRSGNIITFVFVFTAEAGWDNTSTLITNLPRPKEAMRFLGLNGSTNVPLRFAMNTSGELKNWYSYTKPSGGQVVEVTGTYITTD